MRILFKKIGSPLAALLIAVVLSTCRTVTGVWRDIGFGSKDEAQSEAKPLPAMGPAKKLIDDARTRAALRTVRGIARRCGASHSGDRGSKKDEWRLLDPVVSTRPDKGSGTDKKQKLFSRFGVPSDALEKSRAFVGNFHPRHGDELAVVTPPASISIYTEHRKLATHRLDGDLDMLETGIFQHRVVETVDVVRDGRLEMLIRWRANKDGRIEHRTGIFKMIGHKLTAVFERTLASQSSIYAPLEQKGAFLFLHGNDHAYIRWIPADTRGRLQPGQATILKWNHWEGVYRAPKEVPTPRSRAKCPVRDLSST